MLVVAGTSDTFDVLIGGSGVDSILVAGTGVLTLAGFDATASSIENWAGNGAGVLGTTASDKFDFSGLTSKSAMAYVDGSAGNDVLLGSAFGDDLRGGTGNDRLVGGMGDDRLSGGSGNDTFAFLKGHGHDTITDFAAGAATGDRIELDHQVYANFNSVLAASHQLGNDVVISADGLDSITLTNMHIADLHQNDFVFV